MHFAIKKFMIITVVTHVAVYVSVQCSGIGPLLLPQESLQILEMNMPHHTGIGTEGREVIAPLISGKYKFVSNFTMNYVSEIF